MTKLFFVWFLALLPVVNLSAAMQWKPISSRAYQFPYGVSKSDTSYFANPVSAKHLKADYTGDTSCFIEAQSMDVTLASGEKQKLLPNPEGIFTAPEAPFIELVVHARSSKWSKVSCTETVFVLEEAIGEPELFLGSLDIAAVSAEAILELSEPAKLSQFEIEVPRYCKELNIVTALTRSEGHWDAAKLKNAERRIYSVESERASRISAIKLQIGKSPKQICRINFYGAK